MSGVLGVFSRSGAPLDERALDRMVERLRALGNATAFSRPHPGAVVAVVRHEWERTDHLSGQPLVFESGDRVVAADASLYYTRDLEARLAMRGATAEGGSPSHLISAAYGVWGERCVERLEGEYAFVVYDRRRRGVLCARDPFARRPLFYAELGDTLVVASAIGPVLAHPRCSRRLNLAAIGAAAAFLPWAGGSDTCYEAVHPVPMASTLWWCDGRTRIRKHWEPREVTGLSGVPFEQAAAELREMLAQAVSERMSPTGVSAVWMSGGYDSTAVFGAAQHVLSDDPGGRRLLPVSLSYPPGDPGRENDLIEAVADFWDEPIHWIDVDTIDMFDRVHAWAGEREQPVTSPYVNWNLALARGARDCGARVALDGNGGDQVFGGSITYMSDLLSRGRWLALAREIWAKRGVRRRELLHSIARPVVPERLLALRARLKGWEPPTHPLESPIPPWVDRHFAARHGLLERERAALPLQSEGDRADAELRWSLSVPLYGYGHGLMQPLFLRAGVLVRSPLLDTRIVEFALRRPRPERVSLGENKRLLRAAMKGLLPASVLAPRPRRTGVTIAYSRRSMKARLARLFDQAFESPLILAELGAVDPNRLRRSIAAYRRSGGDDLRLALFHTLQTELWLRGHCDELPLDAAPVVP